MIRRNKNSAIYILFAVMFVILIWVEQISKPINWNESFKKDNKDPFGSIIVFDILQDIFPGEEIITSNYSFYYFLKNNNNINGNLILISNDLNINSIELDAIKSWVQKGNSCFISTSFLNDTLMSFLGLQKDNTVNFNYYQSNNDSVSCSFTNPDIYESGPYFFSKLISTQGYLFTEQDKTEILGRYDDDKANFLSVAHGKGKFYFHANPQIFTNYNILSNDGKAYIERVFSHLKPGTIIWDELYKPGRNIESPFRYFLQTPPLKASLYLAIFTLLLYAIFQSKRRQNKIPIITPLQNTSIEFARTIGHLYFYKHNNKDILLKQLYHLNELILSRYYITINFMNDEKANALSSKTGISIDVIKRIAKIREIAEKSKTITDKELETITKEINNFRNKCENYGNI